METLWDVARDCARVPGTPSEDVARTFLETYSWDVIADRAREVTRVGDETLMDDVTALCEKMSSTVVGAESLSESLDATRGRDAVDAWLRSSDERVVRLACGLVGAVFARGRDARRVRALGEATRSGLARVLVRGSTETASLASKALLSFSGRAIEGLEETLRAVLETAREEGANGEGNARALAFAASAASASDAAAEIVVGSGSLNQCVREIESEDLLAASAAMEILAEVAESSPGAASGLRRVDSLRDALERIALDESGDIGVRMRAIVVGARIAATSTSGDDALVKDATRTLLELSNDEPSRDVLDAVADAAGAICLSNASVAGVFVTKARKLVFDVAHRALRGSGQSQVVALHSMANMFGAERGDDRSIGVDAEAILADACFTACGPKTFGDVVFAAISVKSDHFLDLRVAAYRLIGALGDRRPFAEEIAAHPECRRTLCQERERVSIAATFRARALEALSRAEIADQAARAEFASAVSAPSPRNRVVARPDVDVAHR